MYGYLAALLIDWHLFIDHQRPGLISRWYVKRDFDTYRRFFNNPDSPVKKNQDIRVVDECVAVGCNFNQIKSVSSTTAAKEPCCFHTTIQPCLSQWVFIWRTRVDCYITRQCVCVHACVRVCVCVRVEYMCKRVR